MLEMFKISANTDGDTRCAIYVEPGDKRIDVIVTVRGLIVREVNETDPSFRSVSGAEWHDIAFWERRALAIAKAYSPFYTRPEG